MTHAYETGSRDPALLAALGLWELESGDGAAARPFLEAAVQAGVVRPRAYIELARMRWADSRARAKQREQKIEAAEVEAIIKLLLMARAQKPPQVATYELLAVVWTESAATPAREHLAVLDEGARLFPHKRFLTVCAIALHAQCGLTNEAASLIAFGAAHAPDDRTRDGFESMRELLARGGSR